jgi:hypothetical protein
MPSAPDSAQWHWLLRSFARLWTTSHDTPALRQLMVGLGSEFADSRPLSARADQPGLADLADLEHAVNTVWADMHWGRAIFTDSGQALHIEHRDAPLARTFGAANLAWSAGLLEGMYAGWLRQAGAPAPLVLRGVDPQPGAASPDTLEFVLSARPGP